MMNYTIEYNQGFYHALRKNTQVDDCPYHDERKSVYWMEGFFEGAKALKKYSN